MNAPTNILQFTVKNNSDKKRKVSLFELFSDNLGVSISTPYLNSTYNSTNTKLWLTKHKLNIGLIRLMWNDKDVNKNIYFRYFTYVCGTPFGRMMTVPLFIVGENFSPNQFQECIIDLPSDFELDGFSTDIVFDLYPNDEITISMFEKEVKEKNAFSDSVSVEKHNTGLTPFVGIPIVVENNSDTDLEVDLFSPKLHDEYVKGGKIKIYRVWEGQESFGNKYTNDQEYSYVTFLQRLVNHGIYLDSKDPIATYDCIKIINPYKNGFNDI